MKVKVPHTNNFVVIAADDAAIAVGSFWFEQTKRCNRQIELYASYGVNDESFNLFFALRHSEYIYSAQISLNSLKSFNLGQEIIIHCFEAIDRNECQQFLRNS